MGDQRKKRPPKPPQSDLQRMFVKRVREEMDWRGLNPTALARRLPEERNHKTGKPQTAIRGQTTISDVMRGADPRLQTVERIAKALGVAALELFVERDSDARSKLHAGPSPRISEPAHNPWLSRGKRERRSGDRRHNGSSRHQ